MNERSIFLEALEITAPAERAAFLDRVCNGNADLRTGVESLLAANACSGSFMRKPACGDVTTVLRPSEGPGSRVGPYKLLQEIGEGGMGVVYMAEQEQPVRRKVALKIIKPGMDSKQVVARFEAERQALGMMDHPNIAKVFDAGTTDTGLPYFVMELVHGVPITEYCDANKLNPRERLELFVPVCQAIQHAHMKGIIHRDIKPSNVLVTMYDDKPVPKVIDFGVAKAVEQRLTEKTLFTQYGALVGTFEYMSPEQAEMNAFGVDTRSDVYSLGVLLYELLTGTTPLERQRLRTAAFGEVVRLIKEEEPPRPSMRISTSGTLAKVAAARKTEPGKLSNLVRGELDWIVMRCLEKDRTRRYDGAATLAKDVQRYLVGEAVEACPPTLGYRLKKAYRRNKAALTTAAVVAMALIAGTVLSVWQAVAARRAEALAVVERDEKEKARLAEAEQRTAAVAAAAETSAANEKLRLAQDRATRLLYVSQMNHASSALSDNRLRQLQQILTEATPAPGEPDLRNWEWNYLDRLLRTDTEHKLDFGSGRRDAAFRSWNYVTENGCWAVRGGQEGDGVVFDVIDTPNGKPVGRIPKAGTLPDVSKGNKDLWNFPVLSTDGRYLLLTEAVYQESKPATPITRRPRMWEVATGMEVAAPPDPLPREMAVPFYTIEVGPGGEWVTWLDAPSALKSGGSAGPVEVTIHRWEKANGLLPPKAVRVGAGWGRLVLGPDGRTLFWVPQRPNSAPWSGKKDWPETPYRLEAWDIADAPKLRWSVDTLRPTTGLGYQPRLYTALSPSRTSVAVLGADDIAVHSVADGKLLWRSAYPEKRPITSDVGYRVSDDGDRIVCTWDQTIAILDRRASGQPGRPPFQGAKRPDVGSANARQILYRNRFIDDPPADDRTGTGRGESLSFHLLPDGKTLVGHDRARGAVRVWDVSPPAVSRVTSSGTQIDFVDGQRTGSARSADGRLTARWGGRDEPTAITLEASGREYGRIELPAKGERAGTVLVVKFLDAGRRVLVTATLGAEPHAGDILPSSKTNQWLLFDIETAHRVVKVAEGNGSVALVPNSRYFWSADSGYSTGLDGAAGTRNGVGGVDIRDGRTGRAVYEFRPALPAAVITPGPESFDPTGERVISITGKAEEHSGAGWSGPVSYVNPERVDVVEIATGKRLWGIDLTAEGANRAGFVGFSPDGRYVLILGTTPQREAYLSVYSAADGAKLWTADSYARGTTSGTRIIGFSPDGRLVAIGDGDAAEVRDLQSGKRIHRFTGHLDTPDSAIFTPDNSRLFVSFRWVSSARQAQPRLHVWDLTTGRELLTLPSIQQLQRYDAGKLFGSFGMLDGSLAKP